MKNYSLSKNLIKVCAFFIVVAVNCSSPSEGDRWIKQTIKNMSIEEKVGQLVDLWLDAREIGKDTYIEEKINEIKNYHIGSYMFLMIPGDMYAIAQGVQRLQEVSKIPLIIGTNSEGGAGGFVTQAVRFPTQMAMGATRDSALTYEAGRIMALESKALGVDMACIPNGSLNNNPNNPVINVRAFSDDPKLAAQMVVAYVRGLQDHGFPAQVGLFPGHGDTDVDSHLSLPTLNVQSRDRLFSTELVPFIAAFDAGCSSVMTAHVIIPSLDPKNPATLSKIIITDLLRKELHFDGLVYTDAIRMKAITNHYGVGESAVLSLTVGNDVLVWPSDYKTVIDSVLAAVRSGRLMEARLDESLRRRFRVKVMAEVHKYALHPIDSLESKIGLPEYREIAQKIADKSITVAKDDAGLIPIKNMKETAFLMLGGNPTIGKEVLDSFPGCPVLNVVEKEKGESLEIDPDPSRPAKGVKKTPVTAEKAKQKILRRLLRKQSIMVVSFLGRGSTLEQNRGYFEILEYLIKSGKKVCLISLGDPYIYRFIPSVQTYVCGYGSEDFIRWATWKVLKGTTQASGQLPIKIPGL